MSLICTILLRHVDPLATDHTSQVLRFCDQVLQAVAEVRPLAIFCDIVLYLHFLLVLHLFVFSWCCLACWCKIGLFAQGQWHSAECFKLAWVNSWWRLPILPCIHQHLVLVSLFRCFLWKWREFLSKLLRIEVAHLPFPFEVLVGDSSLCTCTCSLDTWIVSSRFSYSWFANWSQEGLRLTFLSVLQLVGHLQMVEVPVSV